MTTTIAVKDGTLRMLASLKQEWGASSYDEVVRKLVEKVRPVPASMFGASPDLPRLTRKLRSEMFGEEQRFRRWQRGRST